MALKDRIKARLKFLYPGYDIDIFDRLDHYRSNLIIREKRRNRKRSLFSEKDAIVITYGDSIQKKGEKPLKTLHRFLKTNLGDSISGVHILPFFPYSSDDGFSIIDYKKVDPGLGDWSDIRRMSKDYRIMADLVINHISSRSEWFKGFLRGEEKYQDYFISFDKNVDTSNVFRPRTHPLLTRFKTKKGDKYVWTTFSADQIDLNFSNPEVFIEMMEVLLFYLSQGIEIIRLDAVGFLWKKLGTSCFHMEETHEAVKLLRDIAEYVAPYAAIITETNVPYKENISYFGKGDEAHMVYQFSLPPLVLDAFNREDSSHLKELYSKLTKLPKGNLFFNFLASHDGIGVLGAKGYLSDSEFDLMINNVKRNNGLISYKSLTDGSKTPYEMNINYFDAINNPNINRNYDEEVAKFLASQSVIVFSKGVPGIYIHSLLGSRNWYSGVKRSGINRRINREKLDYEKLCKDIKHGIRNDVLAGYKCLLNLRRSSKDFSPYSSESIINSDSKLLVLERRGSIVAINLSSATVKFNSKDIVPYGIYLFH
ncbi:sugar phosphorylase [Candidatus Woesearchaeota archaeon]|nr:sugar phosphorylase [Candidatus Woesearchaeota archaeon]